MNFCKDAPCIHIIILKLKNLLIKLVMHDSSQNILYAHGLYICVHMATHIYMFLHHLWIIYMMYNNCRNKHNIVQYVYTIAMHVHKYNYFFNIYIY